MTPTNSRSAKTGRTLIPALLFVAIVVVAANAWLAFRSLMSLKDSQNWLEHTRQVIDQTDQMLNSVRDAQAAVQGYVAFGNAAYLTSYQAATQRLPDELDRFQSLTADNAKQQARLTEMRGLLAHRFRFLQQVIEARRSGGQDEVHVLTLLQSGAGEMAHLRDIVGQMQTEERGLLATRTRTVQKDFWRAGLALALATGLDLLLILAVFGYLARERVMRLTAEVAAKNLEIAQQEAEQKAEEIRSLNATLETRVHERTAELEITNKELEAFSYSVSHDLRAPLRTIDGFSLALEEDYMGVVDEVGRDYIRRVRAGVQRMGQLIDALLQLSRITRADIAREDFDLSEMAESVVANLKEENPGRTIDFHVEPNQEANGDPRLVRVALENLLGNAVKFSSKVAEAKVDFGWDPVQSAWYVRDNGAGFDMHYAGKLFNAFNRLHGDKDFKGSGIGLATVARVVRRHHGRIWADSIEGQGATFWFTLGNASND